MLRISQTPTEYIAIHAGVDSDHESVDFALVKVNTDFLNFLVAAMALAGHAKGAPIIGSSVDSICFDLSPEGWHVVDYDQEEQSDLVDHLSKNSWCYVELEEDYEPKEPEYSFDCDKLYVDYEGVFKFNAFGKYSSTRAWTAEIGYLDILKTLKPATV